jgi:hypothetical protein
LVSTSKIATCSMMISLLWLMAIINRSVLL